MKLNISSFRYTDPAKYCQVCGFAVFENEKKLYEWDFLIICPCCGIHYGNDDFNYMISKSIEKYSQSKLVELPQETYINLRVEAWEVWRERWISGGMKFWSQSKRPIQWNPLEQIKNIDIILNNAEETDLA